MTQNRINKVLAELKQFELAKKQLEKEIDLLQSEVKDYMTEQEISELFNEDKSIVARYSEAVRSTFDSTSFRQSEWGELYEEYTKKTTYMRFSVK